MKTAGVKSSL